MLPFFRKIRWRLAKDNQFLKYSRYAIGEIVLVVIGILIALQINNWNENKKDLEREQNLLKQLKEDYKANLAQLENKIEMRTAIMTQCLDILEIIANSSTISDDSLSIRFATLFMDPTFDPIDIDLSSSGDINLIRNDSLKRYLSHWNSDIKSYNESEQIQHEHYVHEIIPFMKRVGIMRNVNHVFWSAQKLRMGFLDKGENNTVLTPGKSPGGINSEAVLKDSELEGLLTFAFTFSQVCNMEGQSLKKRMQQTIQTIENEIKDEESGTRG